MQNNDIHDNLSPVVMANNLSTRYRDKQVLRNVNLRVEKGAIVCLVGANGAGKSTLLQCLLGLKDCDLGDVELLGRIPAFFDDEIKEKIGYVAQTPDFIPWLRVQDYLDFRAAFYSNWHSEWVNERLATWSVTASSRIASLTVGQKQRLAIIGAMAYQPELLILDEPIAGLDLGSRMDFLREVVMLCANFNTTVLFSTHLFSDIHQIGSHLAWVHDGTVALYADLDDLREHHKIITITPQSQHHFRDLLMPDSMCYRLSTQKPQAELRLIVAKPEPEWVENTRANGYAVEVSPASI